MVAFNYRMPAGIPGDINRISAATVETQIITPTGTSGVPTAYGQAVVIDATTGNARLLAATDSSSPIYGFLARPFPTGGSQDPLATSTVPASGPCDVMVRGYMTVLLGGNIAAVKGAPAYVWCGATSSPNFQNTVVGTSSTVNTIKCGYFMGPADSNGITELAFNI